MATSSSSSSLLLLFIDTDLDTHFSFTIDGHQSVAQLKGRIVSEHANCLPGFGQISVMAVKAKIGEFFYHLSDFMTLNCFFQSVEGVKRFQVDIVRVSSTSKSSDQVKTNTGARMHNGQPEKLEHLNCKSSDGASTLFDAKMKEKLQFDASLKDSRYFKPRRIKKNEVSSNGNDSSVDDSLPKITGTPSDNPPEEILIKETISICNNKCSDSYILEASVQLDTNTSTKDLSALKRKRKRKKKVSRNVELSGNPLVEDTLHKVNDTRADNQGIATEAISIRNDFGNESGIAASIKESSQPNTVQHVGSSLQTKVDDKHYNSNCDGSGSKRLNTEKADFCGRTKDNPNVDLDNTRKPPGIDSEFAVEQGDGSMSKVGDASQKIQIKKDVDAHMEKKLPETDEVVNCNRIHGAPVQLDSNATMKNSADPKHKRKKKKSTSKELCANPLVEDSLHKIIDTRADNQPKDSIVKETISNSNDFGNDPPTQFSNDPATQIPNDRFILGLAISSKETISEATGKHGAENIATMDSKIKEIASTQKRRQKSVVRKIPRSRFGNQSMESNEDELAPTSMQSEKNDGSGSNTYETEKAKSGSHAKDDSNVSLDTTKTLPVEHGDGSMSKVGDASQKIQIKKDIDAHMEKKLPETDEVVNCNRIHGAPVQLDNNTTMKDSADPKHKRKKKKSTSKELCANPLIEDSLHKIIDTRADNQPKDSIVKETISNSNDFGNDPPTQFSNDPATQIPNDRFILGLAISLKEPISEATGKHGAENIATMDSNIKEIASTQKRRQKCVVRKIPRSRFGNQLLKSNEDELAPTSMQSEKNDSSGSNTYETEKAKSGSHAKDDSNVSLDTTKTLPEKRRRRLFFSSPVGENKGTSFSGLEN